MKESFLKKTNKIISVCLVLFGIAYLMAARNLKFGFWGTPNTGFMPKVAGTAMVLLAIVNMVIELRREDQIPEELQEVHWPKAFLYIGCCAAYVLMLQVGFGYIIATPICLLAMIKCTGIKGWVVPIVTTVLVTGFFYGIFNMLMGVYLPRIELF